MGGTGGKDLRPYAKEPAARNARMMPVVGQTALEGLEQQNQTLPSQSAIAARGKVAILLPLSGQHEKIGQSM